MQNSVWELWLIPPIGVRLQLCYVLPSIPFKRPLFSGELCVRDALWSHWLPIVCREALLSCSFVMTVGQPLYRLNKITQLFIWGPNPSTSQHPHQPPNQHLEKPLKPPKTAGHSLSLNTSHQLKKLDRKFSTGIDTYLVWVKYSFTLCSIYLSMLEMTYSTVI